MMLVIFNRPPSSTSGPRPGRLVYQVIDKDFMLYNIHVMDVPPDCPDMHSGKFVNFREDLRTNPVKYHYNGPEWPHRTESGPFQQDMARMIEWCADNVTEELEWWHFELYVTSVSTVTATFYFTNEQTALEFKLACL